MPGELDRLLRQAERRARKLQQTMAEIEQARAEALPPEERRRRFRVIGGSGVVAAGLGWALTRLRRPEVALTLATAWGLGTVVAQDPPPAPEPPPAVAPAPTPAPPPAQPIPSRSAPAVTPPANDDGGGNGGEARTLPTGRPAATPGPNRSPAELVPEPEPQPTSPPASPPSPSPTPSDEPATGLPDPECLVRVELLGVDLCVELPL